MECSRCGSGMAEEYINAVTSWACWTCGHRVYPGLKKKPEIGLPEREALVCVVRVADAAHNDNPEFFCLDCGKPVRKAKGAYVKKYCAECRNIRRKEAQRKYYEGRKAATTPACGHPSSSRRGVDAARTVA